jgi:hypothetical protein
MKLLRAKLISRLLRAPNVANDRPRKMSIASLIVINDVRWAVQESIHECIEVW